MKKILYVAMTVMLVVMLAVVASATTTLTFDLEETTTDDGQPVNVIVATMTDDVGDWRALKLDIAFDNGIIVPVDYIDGSIPDYSDEEGATYPFAFGSYKTGRSTTEISIVDGPNWVMNGANSTMGFESYWSQLEKYPIDAAEGFVVFELFFKFADGKTANDLVYTSFQPTYAKYTGGQYFHFIGNADASLNDIVVVNNVVPEAPVVVPVTIPVLAGDIVYLQDGTKVNIAETNEAYVLTADVGYVVVNTGYDAQKTYYINGESAELVHTDAVLGSELYSLRDRTPVYDAVKGEEIDKNGLRFQMLSSQSSRNVADPHDVVEAGFLMTAKVQKVVDAYGESPELTHDKVESGLGLVKKGVAYDPANGIDIRMGSEDGIIDIRGVFYNIPITQKNVTTTIISRPYYKVGNTYVYGEASETTLYDVAVALRASENWDTMSEGQQNYVNEIVAQVDGWTEIVEEEIVIDIGGLYGSN